MFDLNADNLSASLTYEGDMILSFTICADSQNAAQEAYLALKDKKTRMSLKKWTRQRSLEANAFLWRLCTLVGAAIGCDKEDVYRKFIREASIEDTWQDGTWENDKIDGIARLWGKGGLGCFHEVVDVGETHMRRYRVVKALYLSAQPVSAQEVADIEMIDTRTVYKDVNAACVPLSTLLFGVDALRG